MTKHYALFALICLSALVGLALLGPLPQDPLYHQFADQRPLLGIANFLDVISNLPFVIIGLLGLGYLAPGCLRRGRPAGGLPPLLLHYRIFFVGVLLTGLGSGYYHLAPDNHTLVWDRLPMTIAFMAFFAALVGESLSLRAGRLLLWPRWRWDWPRWSFGIGPKNWDGGICGPMCWCSFCRFCSLPTCCWFFPLPWCPNDTSGGWSPATCWPNCWN